MLAGELPEARTAGLRELRDPESDGFLDEALVLRFDSPASSTGEDTVEFQCHGGRAIVDAVLRSLERIDGLRAAKPGEFTRRAFENGRIDLTEAEGLADLIEAETESQRKAALAVAEGGLRKQIGQWQQRLIALSAMAERVIDYDEDDLGPDSTMTDACRSLGNELFDWVRRPRVEPLKDGIRVVVAGPPNAGKSSLINVIAGQDRAIVTELPGTTRDHIEVPLSLAGIPIVLTDTAGLRAALEPVEAIGVARAAALMERADIIVWLGDGEHSPQHPRVVMVHAKADLPERGETPLGALGVSSVTGAGVPALIERIGALARALLLAEDQIALNRRQAGLLAEAADALTQASDDPVLVAESLRIARSAFDRLTGRAGVEDVLDALFGRFCLGK
jgi:tRNA modification GTPase